jgi:excisionase family DNA binding protein
VKQPLPLENRLGVSLDEGSAVAGLSRRTLEYYIQQGVLPARKIGRRTLILVSDLRTFLRRDQRSVSPARRAASHPESSGQ